ncbi:hypothetical protein HK097_005243 [Rhizophlyctis rosea]|uniref:Uncharacterized protein n=1 Tax=Rhizophlyctis rosea TaxID=64517 RepID=A0AAD5S0E0_9FUNG|nr:hypothetical protein HK097_005243 [Rhizophlyctis rosea]
MKNAKSFASSFRQSNPDLHGLVISSGLLSMAGRTETEEGIDRKLAVHYYGRARLILELLPLLEETAKKGEDVRVMTVLAAGKGGKVNWNDKDLKTSFSLKAAADHASTFSDLLVQELAKRHPTISFIHIYPGVVDTPLMNGLPAPMRLLSKALAPLFAVSASDCGDAMTYALTSDRYKSGGKGWLVTDKGEPVREDPALHNDEDRKKAWEHTLELTNL